MQGNKYYCTVHIWSLVNFYEDMLKDVQYNWINFAAKHGYYKLFYYFTCKYYTTSKPYQNELPIQMSLEGNALNQHNANQGSKHY